MVGTTLVYLIFIYNTKLSYKYVCVYAFHIISLHFFYLGNNFKPDYKYETVIY